MARVAKTKTPYIFPWQLLWGIIKRSHYDELHLQGKDLLLNSRAQTNAFNHLLRWPLGIWFKRVVWLTDVAMVSPYNNSIRLCILHFELKFPLLMDISACVWNAAPNQELWTNKYTMSWDKIFFFLISVSEKSLLGYWFIRFPKTCQITDRYLGLTTAMCVIGLPSNAIETSFWETAVSFWNALTDYNKYE